MATASNRDDQQARVWLTLAKAEGIGPEQRAMVPPLPSTGQVHESNAG